MKAAVLWEAGQEPVIEDVDVAPHGPNEVLVRVAASGVCHSDLSVVKGKFPVTLPSLLGHEGAGVVEEVGTNVDHLSPGDHVLMLWRSACGECYYCRAHRPALCQQGVDMRLGGLLPDGTTRYSVGGRPVHHFAGISTFAEQSVVPASGLIRVDPQVPLDRVALIGCAVLTGVGAAFNAADLKAGTSTVVIGCGGVGLNVIQGCAIVGASPIIAVDVVDSKLELARQFGATDLVDARDGDVADRVRALTGGLGSDHAFVAVGSVEAIGDALAMTRRAGTVIAVGVPPMDAEFAFSPLALIMDEKTIRGTLYGSCDFAVDVPRVIDLYLAGRLKLDELISHEFPLEELGRALEQLERGDTARSVIRLAD